MSGVTYDYMEQYIRGLISPNEGILKELEDYAATNSVPIIQKEVGKFLELMINIKKPSNILEKLEGQFDFIFMEAGKGHYNHFLPYCLKLLSKDGIIVADNVLFKGMVASRDLLIRRKITIVKRMKTYLEMISTNDELITSVIPMGDGIAVTTRRNSNE